MSDSKSLVLDSTAKEKNNSLLCAFNKVIVVDGVVQENDLSNPDEGPHLLSIPAYVGPDDSPQPTNLDYIRGCLDRWCDDNGFSRVTDDDWSTILSARALVIS